MKPARMLLVTAFLASAPVWVACGDDPTEPVRVRITGSWTGTILRPTGDTCPLDPTIAEDNNGDITGTADLQDPCVVATLTVTGTNNTGGVPDSVELFFSSPAGSFIFNGNYDGVNAMLGLTLGGGCTNCPTSFTR